MPAPVKIERRGDYMLRILWKDGFDSTIRLKDLRFECPCAKCEADKEAKQKSPIPVMPLLKEGMNTLMKLEKIGNYAIKPVWGDGHDLGMYSWDTLRGICAKYAMTDQEIEELLNKK
jgi:DUF971 family protein